MPAQGFAQASSPLLTLIAIFGRLSNHFKSSRGGPELVLYIKMSKMCPIFETNSLVYSYYFT